MNTESGPELPYTYRTKQMKYKLHDECSNNQAEEVAIVEALQAIYMIRINKNVPRTIIIHKIVG